VIPEYNKVLIQQYYSKKNKRTKTVTGITDDIWLDQFSKSEKFMLLQGYVEAKRGSKQLYEGLQVSFLKSSFSDLTATNICGLAWCFSEAENNTGPLINTGQLFDTLEREILTKGKCFFRDYQLNRIKKSFQKVGKGTNELFDL
jgi:hypothetical protein